jgi:hypothetical protein
MQHLLEHLQQDLCRRPTPHGFARNLNQGASNPVRLYKNNTDFYGIARLPRKLSAAASLALGLPERRDPGFPRHAPDYVRRGKFGWEDEDKYLQARISRFPRGATFSSNCRALIPCSGGRLSIPATNPTPIAKSIGDFHVILGDSNLSLYSTYLKIGATALVLQALLNGAPCNVSRFWPIRCPRLRTFLAIAPGNGAA